MLTKIVKYTDFDGEERSETLHFHLTKAEIIAIETDSPNGFITNFQRSIETGDNRGIWRGITLLVQKSYGVKDEVSQRFIKKVDGENLYDNFISTEAYSALVDGFLEDPNTMADFINGIMPKKALEEAKKQLEAQDVQLPAGD